MARGTVVINGITYQVIGLRLHGGLLWITARHHGPVRPCTDVPAAVFGDDGKGVCQTWNMTIPATAAAADFVTVELPVQFASFELKDGQPPDPYG